MKTTYIKPQTTAQKLHGTNVMLGTSGNGGGVTEPPRAREHNTFDFFSFEEEEEVPGKSDDEDWEDWEDEDDP